MENVLGELLRLLELEKIEENYFRGNSQDLGFRSVFGGQVLGQALVAAKNTVENRRIHSLHGYFLRPGDAQHPIMYTVDRIRDGKSFTTRRVVAVQKGNAIFNMSASFQIEESGFEHQAEMPDVPGPEGLMSELEMAIKVKEHIHEKVRDKFTCVRPVEIRPIDPVNYFTPEKRKPVKYHWFRTVAPLPDDRTAHECLLAYASDFGLLGTCLLPHGVTWAQRGMQVTSLDHAMWFHHDFRMDDWLLYAMESPSSSHALGLNQGNVFTREGKLVATVTQEGLIRRHPQKTS
ncbi:acyl-CoA thioesterase II [Deltaproteobacteria bacterium TL4]